LNTSYHSNTVTSTVDVSLVCRPLRRTLSFIASLTRRRGYCYAGWDFLASKLECSTKTVRRHVARLIASGILRVEQIRNLQPRFFICPESVWNVGTVCPDSVPALPIEGEVKQKSNKQPGRKRTPAPITAQAEASPVVCSSAKPLETEKPQAVETVSVVETETQIGITHLSAISAQEETAEDVAALLRASLDAAGEEMQALESGESLEESAAVYCNKENSEAIITAATHNIAPAAVENMTAAVPALQVRPYSDTPPKPQPQPLTPEQTAIMQALVQAGVAPGQARQMVQRDATKAQEVMKAYRAEVQRGREIESAGGWIWSLWNREGFRYVERGQKAAPSHLAKDQGLRIVPTGTGDRGAAPPASGAEVLAALRRRGFGTSARA